MNSVLLHCENESSAAWDVGRPSVRLWLTLALGLLGALLFRGDSQFFINPWAGVRALTFFAWMTAAFASVLALHRAEKVKVRWGTAVLAGLALASSTVFLIGPLADLAGNQIRVLDDFEEEVIKGLIGLAWLCLMCLLLLVAGAYISGLRFRRGSRRRCLAGLLRGPLVALAAPLLLFGSRPDASDRPSSRMQALSRAAFALFPHAIAAGFATALFGDRYPQSLRLGVRCLSFSIWAWLACALLVLLSPWPEYPRARKPRDLPEERVAGLPGTAVFTAMAVAILAGFGFRSPWNHLWLIILFTVFLVWFWLAFAVLLFLGPWPVYPRVPKLGDLPDARKTGPVATAIFMAIALVPLASVTFSPLRDLVSGRIISGSFNRVDAGSARGGFFDFAVFALPTFAYVATARWMSDRRTRAGYWAFAAPTAALCLCLLGILGPPYLQLLQYIHAMGFTPMRIYGLVYALGGYMGVWVFLSWAVWPPRKGRAREWPSPDSGADDA